MCSTVANGHGVARIHMDTKKSLALTQAGHSKQWATYIPRQHAWTFWESGLSTLCEGQGSISGEDCRWQWEGGTGTHNVIYSDVMQESLCNYALLTGDPKNGMFGGELPKAIRGIQKGNLMIIGLFCCLCCSLYYTLSIHCLALCSHQQHDSIVTNSWTPFSFTWPFFFQCRTMILRLWPYSCR